MHEDILSRKMIPSRRYLELDGMRGIAILGVVIYHFGKPYSSMFPSDGYSTYNFLIGELGVQLFFMISGFVILLSSIKSKKPSIFISSRFSRLYPTYWFALTLSGILLIFPGVESRDISLGQWVINTTMFQRFLFIDNVDQVYWTLAVEMQFYILVALYLWISKGKIREKTIFLFSVFWSLLSFFLCILVFFHGEKGLLKIVFWISLGEYAPLFCLGISLFISRMKGENSKIVFLFMLIAVANTIMRHGYIQGVGVLFLALFFQYVVRSESVPWLTRGPLFFYGKISYPLYLIHTIPGAIIIHYMNPYLGFLGSVFIAFLSVTLFSYLVHLIIEVKCSSMLRHFLFNVFSLKSKN